MKIPFYARYRTDQDQDVLLSCLEGSLATDGPFSQEVLSRLSHIFPESFPVLTSSCSQALEMALTLCGLKPGEEVLLPSYNFPSAANAVLRSGGIPVLCDIDPHTQNISPLDAARRITSKTRVLIPVHYAGISCDMKALFELARESGLKIVEDAAQAIGSSYKGYPLGTLGEFGCVSFHHTKNIGCGEGGLLLCRSENAYRDARCYRVHGTNRDAFIRGECDRYTWVLPGSSTAVSELCAALLSAQLLYIEQITRIRLKRLHDYEAALNPLEKAGYVRLMAIPDYAWPNGHIFYLRFASEALRQHVQELLAANGIDARTHYVPLHLSPMGRKLGYKPEDCPESTACFQTLLRLPIHTELAGRQVSQIAEIITKGCISS
ncbi:MAG: dTDP-4-amino-4,6-dideoxygalactose transaminase [Hungatella sp.]|nr:dTDP-4-amino-4,6-dideoxygalactose transaminase [Hungatella sp.]